MYQLRNSVLLISPVIFWNLSNDFISYRFHGNRVSFWGAIQPESFFRELLVKLSTIIQLLLFYWP